MLQSIWDKAVHTYQAIRQGGDQARIDELDRQVRDAKKGYRLYVSISPIGYGTAAGTVELTPEEAAKLIEDCQKQRAELVKSMEQRREKYGLRP
jgi:hypothetical protein